jgi:hypothetical protein
MTEIGCLSLFLSLTQRNISPEIFFDSLLSEEDLSKLLCSCRGMKEQILKWKNIFPIQEYTTGVSLTDKMFENMILHYSQKIKKLIISSRSKLTLNGYYKHFFLLHPNLLELDYLSYLKGVVPIISSSLVKLTSLRISTLQSHDDLSSIRQLTNLEKLDIDSCFNLDPFSLVSYSTLTKMKSISLSRFNGERLDWLVTNKVLLVEIKIDTCGVIPSEEYHCLSTLTNLTHVSFVQSKFDDIGLNLICSSCRLIKYLYLVYNEVTINGLNNFYFLVHLTSLFILLPDRQNCCIGEKISHNIALTHLTVFNDFNSSFCRVLIPSELINLTYLCVLTLYGNQRSDIYLYGNQNALNLLNLKILEIHDSTISKIEYLKSLTQLKIDNCTVNHIGFRKLSSLLYLSHLKLTNSVIISPRRDFAHISYCTSLTFLDLRGTAATSDDELSNFSSLIQLTHLKFCGENITENGLSFLYFIFNTLQYLKIEGGQSLIIIKVGYKYLAKCTNLTYLSLSRCTMFTGGVKFLRFLFKLSYLDLGHSYIVEDEDLIVIKSKLTNLSILKIANTHDLFF